MSQSAEIAATEPLRWSVIADDADHIWLRIGNDMDGVGIWLNTGDGGPRYAKFADLAVACVLAVGLDEPIPPTEYRYDLSRVTPPEVGA